MVDEFERVRSAVSSRYRVERELGRGGMATVYLAYDSKLDRRVALKVLRPEFAALGAERFLREIKLTAHLDHPCVLPLLDAGEAAEFVYFVMPYKTESLRDRLNRERQLPLEDAVAITRDVADALDAAHRHDVVHRDIKPENILLDDGHAFVADFGIARAIAEVGGEKLTATGLAVGTPPYMSPEQAAGERDLDGRSDVYALGCVLFEMLAGQPPFIGPTAESVVHQHLVADPPSVSAIRSTVPGQTADAVRKALAKARADRFSTAGELVEQISAAPSSAPKPVKKRPWRVFAVMLAVLGVLAVALVSAILRPNAETTLVPGRVAVAVFENETGDVSLDPLGQMAGNFITQALQQTQLVEVLPWENAKQASAWVRAERDAGRVRDPIRVFAEEVGNAQIVITGRFYESGGVIHIQTDIHDATEAITLAALDPIEGVRDSLSAMVAHLRDRVVGSMAVLLDERLSDAAGLAQRPPSLEAFGEFSEGLDAYIHNQFTDDAIQHFVRAFALDTAVLQALIYRALVHNNRGEFDKTDSIVKVLDRYRVRLTPYERGWVDYLRARADRDNEAALMAIRRAAEAAPGSKAVYNRAFMAFQRNRPQEAVDALRTLDPERGPMRGWIAYWNQLTNSLHALGRYDEELAAARQAVRQYPDHQGAISYLARALAASRPAEFDSLARQHPPRRWRWTFAAEMRAHGHEEASDAFIARSIEYFQSPDILRPGQRHDYGDFLIVAGRWDAARAVFQELIDEGVDKPNWLPHLGEIAVLSGNMDAAQAVAEELAEIDEPRQAKTVRAYIEAWFGDRREAVSLLRDVWFDEYHPSLSPNQWHYHPVFAPLRDDPAFQELIRPRGP